LARSIALATVLLLGIAATAHAVPFTGITLGDRDSFGIASLAGRLAANGGPVDTDGDGILGPGDFLPDLNGDGVVAVLRDDNFDNRTGAEKAGTALTGTGFTDAGSRGSQWTDLSLSSSFTPAIDFPDGDPARPNAPHFVFDFTVAAADAAPGTPMVLTVVFADFAVGRGRVDILGADGSTTSLDLTPHPRGADGLVQALVVPLSFDQVFVPVAGGFRGTLTVDFGFPVEPYLAFDFAELGALAQSAPVAEPSTILLLGSGLVLLAIILARRRVQTGRVVRPAPASRIAATPESAAARGEAEAGSPPPPRSSRSA
jgi:hypothetical protein